MTRSSSKLIFERHIPAFRFIGRYACFDFVNTGANKSGEITDLLLSYEDLITWLSSAKLFSRSNLKRALEEWNGKSTAEGVFKRALILRKCLDEMASEIAHKQSVPHRAVKDINDAIRRSSGTTRLVRTGQGFVRRFEPDLKQPTELLVPIGESAASLLCEGDLSRVKECASSGCGASSMTPARTAGVGGARRPVAGTA